MHSLLPHTALAGSKPTGLSNSLWVRAFYSTPLSIALQPPKLTFPAAGPIIVGGVALGISAVETSGTPHLSDDHMRWGVAIFVLYFAQVGLGAIIHFVKPKSFADTRRRPAQNYFHAVLGLVTIALSLYQVCDIRFSILGYVSN